MCSTFVAAWGANDFVSAGEAAGFEADEGFDTFLAMDAPPEQVRCSNLNHWNEMPWFAIPFSCRNRRGKNWTCSFDRWELRSLHSDRHRLSWHRHHRAAHKAVRFTVKVSSFSATLSTSELSSASLRYRFVATSIGWGVERSQFATIGTGTQSTSHWFTRVTINATIRWRCLTATRRFPTHHLRRQRVGNAVASAEQKENHRPTILEEDFPSFRVPRRHARRATAQFG